MVSSSFTRFEVAKFNMNAVLVKEDCAIEIEGKKNPKVMSDEYLIQVKRA